MSIGIGPEFDDYAAELSTDFLFPVFASMACCLVQCHREPLQV